MIKRIGIALLVVFVQLVQAEEKTVTGTITYIAAGTVYTSLGKENGVSDSSLVYIRTGADTIAVLKVVATSSKSSACEIVRSKRGVLVGAVVVATVNVEAPKLTTAKESPSSGTFGPLQDPNLFRKTVVSQGPVEFRGRISAQYFATRYDNEAYNTTQPGVVIDLRGRSTDVPIKFELYSNIRTLSYGSANPLSKGALNQSRVYRLSLEYDDGVNDVSFGRIMPTAAPSLGYIDGVMYAYRLDNVTMGTTFGYQPSYSLRGISTEYKKAALFVSVRPVDSTNLIISSAYSRTYYRSVLDREVVNGNVSWYSVGGMQIFGYSEVDLRNVTNGDFKLAPMLTSLSLNLNYRLTEMLSVGIGADASRPLYTFSVGRFIPDSLRETRLRSGLNSSISIYLPGGITLSNSYAPRTSRSRFASVYSNNTTVGFANVLSSGISLRSNFNVNANEYSSSQGYGVGLQRNILDLVDMNVRYQQNTYTLKNYGDKHLSRTFGTDFIVMLTRSLSFMMSYDRLNGYGITSNSFFGEMSVRF